MKKILIGTSTRNAVFAAALFSVFIGIGAQNQSQGASSTAGTLKCDVSGSVSFIFGSTRNLTCFYDPADGGPSETYRGKIEKYGVDIGFVQSGVMLWQVIAPVTDRGPGKLEGTYIGASAAVAAGAGLGANALVGTNNWMLNPVSISGSQGLNIAAGVASVSLRYMSRY